MPARADREKGCARLCIGLLLGNEFKRLLGIRKLGDQGPSRGHLLRGKREWLLLERHGDEDEILDTSAIRIGSGEAPGRSRRHLVTGERW